ncbi:MAG: SDR family oxidoreductase [Promethearchaeota archaeon]|nr:MAG: SDR family oxidoreductase [Candidatus Lokiarchaeota archaeon]
MKISELKNKVAVITGAAGGMGQELAKLLDENGLLLALTDINENGLNRISEMISQKPLTIPCDITQLDQVKNFINKVVSKFGTINFLINTAGIIIPGAFEDLSYEAIEKQITINLLGTINITKETIPIMKKAESGHIITISSLAGIVPETYSSIYTATKFALRGLDFALHFELKKHNIFVSTIFPDSVDTPMLEYEARHDGSPLTFLHDPVQPEAVAKAILKTMLNKKVEVCIPSLEGKLSKFIMCLPSQVQRLWPKYEKKGEKKKEAFIEQIKERNQS